MKGGHIVKSKKSTKSLHPNTYPSTITISDGKCYNARAPLSSTRFQLKKSYGYKQQERVTKRSSYYFVKHYSPQDPNALECYYL